jgi:hypothetical protein
VSDFSPLDLDPTEEVIVVDDTDDESDGESSPEAEAGEDKPTVGYKACLCEACESEEDFGTCYRCDDTSCEGDC